MKVIVINNKFKLLMCTLLTSSTYFALSLIMMLDYSVELYRHSLFGSCFILVVLGVFLFCTGIYFASSFIDRLVAIIKCNENECE